jgi:hypothetical protein
MLLSSGCANPRQEPARDRINQEKIALAATAAAGMTATKAVTYECLLLTAWPSLLLGLKRVEHQQKTSKVKLHANDT